MAQDIQVLGERDPKDKLKNINLTRSVRLNDLTQEELAKLYRRGLLNGSSGSLNDGFKFDYFFQLNTISVALDAVAITYDSETKAVVFDCGYSAAYNRFFKVLLSKGTDGTYSLSHRALMPVWIDKDNLKTINGESLVGTGNIEIAAGNKTGYIYFRFEQCSSIADWRDNMDEIGVYMPSLLGSNEELNTTLSCYCKVQDDDHYQIVPFSLMKYDERFHIFLTMFKPSENVWRRYDISADTWENIVYSQSLTITYTTLNNGQ